MAGWAQVLARRVRERELAFGAEQRDQLNSVQPGLSRAARLLRERFGAKDVILYGSFAWGRPRPHSDIDLAATGIESRRQLEAIAVISSFFERPIDLVRMEDIPTSLRDRILGNGVRL